MFSVNGGVELGNFAVASVSGRGFTPEELAEQALDKIIYVGGNCHQQYGSKQKPSKTKFVGC